MAEGALRPEVAERDRPPIEPAIVGAFDGRVILSGERETERLALEVVARPIVRSSKDVGQHLAEVDDIVGVQGAELAQHEAGLDGGDERFDH